MSLNKKCKNCGSLEIEVESTRGELVCTNCGSILENNIIVAETEFGRNKSTVIGQFVPLNAQWKNNKLGAHYLGVKDEWRKITMKKVCVEISYLCDKLGLNQYCIKKACNLYETALDRNYIRGLRNMYVYGACIYITCRIEHAPHTLNDVCTILETNYFKVGKLYVKLVKCLAIELPLLDPCIYIIYYATKLEFGEKTQNVVETAMRLVKRMKKDNMHLGRKPAGICGAALLLAARVFNFHYTQNDIIKVIPVSRSTLGKRLSEFCKTPSAALSIREFHTIDLEMEQDPPSFNYKKKAINESSQNHLNVESEHMLKNNQQSKISCEQQSFPLSQKCTENNNVLCDDLGNFDDIDDEELNAYFLNEDEVEHKSKLWHKTIENYSPSREKQEATKNNKRSLIYRKQFRRSTTKKKVSSKINYEVLKELQTRTTQKPVTSKNSKDNLLSLSTNFQESVPLCELVEPNVNLKNKNNVQIESTIASPGSSVVLDIDQIKTVQNNESGSEECASDYDDDDTTSVTKPEVNLFEMLKQHRQNITGKVYDESSSDYDDKKYD